MKNIFFKTIGLYFEHIAFVLFSCLFALISISLLPFVATYISGGAGFLRFSSLLFDLSWIELLIVALIFIVALLLISLFVVSVISIVKFKETLDQIGFVKIALGFKKHVLRVFVFFLLMSFVTIGLGTLLSLLGAPPLLAQVFIFIVWAVFIFTPQIMVLENFPLVISMEDSAKFIKEQPLVLFWYLLFGTIALGGMTVLEYYLSAYFIFEHKIIVLLLTTFIFLPMLQIFAALLYVRRYGVARL